MQSVSERDGDGSIHLSISFGYDVGVLVASLFSIGPIVGRPPLGLGPSNGKQLDRDNMEKITNAILVVEINMVKTFLV